MTLNEALNSYFIVKRPCMKFWVKESFKNKLMLWEEPRKEFKPNDESINATDWVGSNKIEYSTDYHINFIQQITFGNSHMSLSKSEKLNLITISDIGLLLIAAILVVIYVTC